jgi:dihydroorotate dehydrogenase (NAD+) catalytic subunit
VGARAVQIGTANFIRPTAGLEVIEGIRRFLIKQGIPKIDDLIGSLIF